MWARLQAVDTAVGQTAVARDLGSGFAAELGVTHLPVGVTIGGIMLDYSIRRNAAGTDAATSNLQIGVLCADEDVASEVQGPLSNPHADWMWQQTVAFPAVTAGTAVSTFDVMGGPVRIRARRRCEELGQHLWIVYEGWDLAPTFNVALFSSVLMLLP